MQIKVTPLGAGQDVGRSCVLVSLNGKNIMFDCGMHMGYSDNRRFPDFGFISRTKKVNQHIDAVIITHFHLDHCGALPYFSEMIGYDGPIYMTQPTKAIAPILLEDYRKIMTIRNGVENFFTSEMIKQCMKKVVVCRLHETIKVDDDLEIKAYYAGHVIGAAMFYAKVGEASVVYTGDYNMTPDRHLGAAWIDKCRPDVLITESTYATTIRDSKRCRERDFLKKVYERVSAGGKVLIPVFALGRAQELCILLETFWDRMDLKVPIYFAAGLTEKANNYYKMFINWTNEKIKKTFLERNMFDFKHISPFQMHFLGAPGAMVLFATPGMLHGGLSLQAFAKWAPDPNNMVIMPGYCVAGTVGHKVLSGQKRIEHEGRTIEVKLAVEHLSFSAHADAKGIMQLIRLAEPRNVMLVHGEATKMSYLKQKISRQFNIPCTYPENGKTVTITRIPPVQIDLSTSLFKKRVHSMNLGRDSIGKRERLENEEDKTTSTMTTTTTIDGEEEMEIDSTTQSHNPNHNMQNTSIIAYSNNNHNYYDNSNNSNSNSSNSVINSSSSIDDSDKWSTSLEGVLVIREKDDAMMRLIDTDDAVKELGLPLHNLSFTTKSPVVNLKLKRKIEGEQPCMLTVLYDILKRSFPSNFAELLKFEDGSKIVIKSLTITLSSEEEYVLNWKYQDEDISEKVLFIMNAVTT